jgi:adenylate kinase family enzyme
MRRVLVMGCSGSGKSTFAMALAGKLGLPFVSLDALFWKPGWIESTVEEFDPKVTAIAAGDTWVIDGNFIRHGAGELRRARADTVIWFDLPRHTCMMGVLGRIGASYGRVRPEMAPGCPEQLDLDFLRYVWTFRAAQRPKLIAYLAGLRPDQRLVTITRRRQAASFLAGVH